MPCPPWSGSLMSLIAYAKEVLPVQGFVVRTIDKRADWLLFEDPAIAGVLVEFPTAEGLIEDWEAAQNTFLHLHQGHLSKASYKAWNLYTVLVTTDSDEPLGHDARG